MPLRYGKRKYKHNSIFYTILTVLLICTVFLVMAGYFYSSAQEEAYENLHVQTKQIKDNIVLQMLSDRENLATMANFASKLHSDGEGYDLMFESFKPIGLIENIGILNPDNTFVTKAGTIDLDGLISFEDEAEKGAYVSSRVRDLTREDADIIRTAVPIKAGQETVGVLYGVIKPEKIGERYNTMAQEFDAQLFVYGKEDGNLVIDTIHKELGNISFLKDRRYNDDYSYEQLVTTDKGFTSFMSVYRDENLHLHYSTIDELGWVIAMGRYDSQVFYETHGLISTFLLAFFIMLSFLALYVLVIILREKQFGSITTCASDIRKTLLETTEHKNHIEEALKTMCVFAKSRSAIFYDTDGESYEYVAPDHEKEVIPETERQYFKSELFRYASEFHSANESAVNVFCIKPNKHLLKTNPDFYGFLKEHGIKEISFSSTINKANHITILAVVNAKHGERARRLAEKVSACFSMALYNKNHLSRTTLAATTDSLTGALNRVAYKSDLVCFDEEKPSDFSCIYVDVNELHMLNNKYGHAAGDEMLLFIANTLKEVFYGHRVYRMGGDEFLVFCQNTAQEDVRKNIEYFLEQLKVRDYHVAVGMSFRTRNTGTEEMVREAETVMYEVKAEYYQNKEKNASSSKDMEFVQLETGILEIDMILSVLKEKYNGIYRVSLSDDRAKRILMPAHFNYNENEEHFSNLFSKYVAASVDPDYHRAMTSFLNYDALKHQLIDGKIPKITYKKIDGGLFSLSIYKIDEKDGEDFATLWFFTKE